MAERIRFYMDEHVSLAVTMGLRRRGANILTAQDSGMLRATDEEHLARAVAEGCVIFTQDSDFLRLHSAGISHRGIAYAPQQTPVGQIVRGLMFIYDALEPDDMIKRVEIL